MFDKAFGYAWQPLHRAMSVILTHFRIAATVPWLAYAARCLLRLRWPGTTAYLLPSRTGGADHSLRAGMSGINPMRFGGAVHLWAQCEPPRVLPASAVVVRPEFIEIVGLSGQTHIVQSGGWTASRRRVRTKKAVGGWLPSTSGAVASVSATYARALDAKARAR